MPSPARPVSNRIAELISRSLAYVETHLDESLDAHTLADQASMSRHHFHRVFQAHMGCSVASYVTWRRLQRACALLASGRESVLEIALSVGYESGQALAKAMRRELGTTPTAVRRDESAPWKSLVPDRLYYQALHPPALKDIMKPTRYIELPEGLVALTATARGMVNRSMSRAAQSAFEELMAAIGPMGLAKQVASHMCIAPDDPQGPDDPHCRYIAGIVLGYDMASGRGQCMLAEVPLTGTLAWQTLDAGPYVIFTHAGPYSLLHQTWRAIYAEWLPASGVSLRDAPPMELCLNNLRTTPPEDLLTEIWLPLLA